MPTGATDYADCDVDRTRLTRMRALLEMFEEDRGRPAATIEELKENGWVLNMPISYKLEWTVDFTASTQASWVTKEKP